MIVAVIGEKGGTGKTTFAVNLAGLRAGGAARVLLVDSDRQGSASYWHQVRTGRKDLPAPDCESLYNLTASFVSRIRPIYDDVIIDVGVGDTDEMKRALSIADVAITTVKPAGIDIWTMGVVEENVAEARRNNPGLVCYATINMASPNPRNKDVAQARDAIRELEGIELAPVVVHSRVAFQRATPIGLTAEEMGQAGRKAADEFRQIYDLVFNPNGRN